jgi:Carboxypeptidase regulatory-like domain
MKNIIYSFLFVPLLLIGFNSFGQGTNGRISGKITIAGGAGLPGATVQIVNTSTGFKTGRSANSDGFYDLRELPLGGPYTLTVSFVGYQASKRSEITLGLGDHVKADFQLKEGTELEAVVVTSNSLTSRTDRLGSAFAITGKTIANIPTPSRNFEQLAFLAGSAYVPDVGQRNLGGFTMAGGKGGNVGYTVDGANSRRNVFGSTLDGAAFTISQEAIREFEVETNAYSVKNGRNSGGVIKAVTKSGTNKMEGGAWYYAGGASLSQSLSPTGAALSSVPAQSQYGVRLSGPIIKDKLFYFAVYDSYKTSPLTDPRTQFFIDYGNSSFTSATDANNFYGYKESDALAILAAGKKKGYDVGETGNLVKDATTDNVFLKLDWNINSKNTASIRYNYLSYNLTNEGISGNTLSLNSLLPFSGVRVNGTNSSNYPFVNLDHKIIADLRTQVSDKITNKMVFQFNTSDRLNNPKTNTQEPRVYVGVPAADGLQGGTVAFGQLTWIPEKVTSTSYQFIDDLTINTGGITWTVGTNNQFYTQQERLAHWTAPVVMYANIDDLNNDKPSFYRQLVSEKLNLKGTQDWNLLELGAYAEAAFKVGENVDIEAGIRWDGWIQGGQVPSQNATLLNSGLKLNGKVLDNSSQLSSLNNWQPRFNATWDINGEKKNILKFGFGLFTSPITTQPITQTMYNDGVSTQQINYTNTADILKNVGAGTFADPATWLSARINPTGEKIPAGSSNVIMLDPKFKMPSTMRFNASYTHFFSDRLKATVTGFYNIGYNDNYWINANRKIVGTNPVDGRDVMGVANTAVKDVVVFTNADWTSEYLAAQLDVQARIGKDGMLSFSYTKATGSGVTTYHAGGVFDDAEYVGANYTDRYKTHFNNSNQNGVGDKVVLIFATPQIKGFNVGFSFIAAQQRRFSIVAGGNPNAATDRDLAYVPTSAELSAADKSVLANVAQEVKDVLKASEGQITGVYQGVYPWMYQTSASLSKRFSVGKYGVTVRADIFNILNVFSSSAGYYKSLNSVQDDYYGRYITLYNYNAPKAATATTAAVPANYSANANQGTYTRGGTPYSIQLGLKLDF